MTIGAPSWPESRFCMTVRSDGKIGYWYTNSRFARGALLPRLASPARRWDNRLRAHLRPLRGGAALRADDKTWSALNSHKHQERKRSMKYYAGLDVSVKETSVCIVDEKGNIYREQKVVSHPDDLVDCAATIKVRFSVNQDETRAGV